MHGVLGEGEGGRGRERARMRLNGLVVLGLVGSRERAYSGLVREHVVAELLSVLDCQLGRLLFEPAHGAVVLILDVSELLRMRIGGGGQIAFVLGRQHRLRSGVRSFESGLLGLRLHF